MLNKLKKIINALKKQGLFNTIHILYFYFKTKSIRKNLAYKYIKGDGIEIGGLINPTPVKQRLANVKYVDFFDEEGLKKMYKEINSANLQKIDYLCKADNLDKINDDSLDFVIGNHLFEHLNNPIKALVEWYRVLKNGGIVFMAVPDKRKTFDKNRERTKLDHIILDYTNPSSERDWEHYIEFAGIDFKNPEAIKRNAKKLLETNYSIHYHVFEEEDISNLIQRCNKNIDIKFNIVHIKHTHKSIGDNEFIFILKAIK